MYSLIEHFEHYVLYGESKQKGEWKRKVNLVVCEQSKTDWQIRMSHDSDFNRFRQLHCDIAPAKVWVFSRETDMLNLAHYISRLWTIPENCVPTTCPLCQSTYLDILVHITGVCPRVDFIRDDFWIDVVNMFSLEVCTKLALLNEYEMLYCLLGKPLSECTQLIDNEHENDFLRVCFSFLRDVTMTYQLIIMNFE